MSDQRRIGPPDGSSEHIQDAEFYEVNDASQPNPPSPTKPKSGWKRGCVTLAIVPVLAIAWVTARINFADPPQQTEPIFNNNADEVAAALDPPASADQTEPSVIDLLEKDDLSVCAHPDVAAEFLTLLELTPKSFAAEYDAAEDEVDRALEQNNVRFEDISASDSRPNIHEVTCQGNIHYKEEGTEVKFLVSYTVRPPALHGGEPVVSTDVNQISKLMLLTTLSQTIKSQRAPKPSEAAPAPPPDVLSADNNASSDR